MHLVAFERLVDQCFILRAGDELVIGAAGPDELADDAHPPIAVLPGEAALYRQKPARVAGDLGDVGRVQSGGYSVAFAAQRVAQRRHLSPGTAISTGSPSDKPSVTKRSTESRYSSWD